LACVLVVAYNERFGASVPPGECKPLKSSKLLVKLPEICPTPDGMATDADGNIIVSCPNYANQSHPELVSGVYRFDIDDENVQVSNTLEDENLLPAFKTLNMDCQYGVDGLVFDSKGNLYIGNFGDGTIYKIAFDSEVGGGSRNELWNQIKADVLQMPLGFWQAE
jgi:sugar lactone lactonase YvrE